MHNNPKVCCVHKGKTGSNESALVSVGSEKLSNVPSPSCVHVEPWPLDLQCSALVFLFHLAPKVSIQTITVVSEENLKTSSSTVVGASPLAQCKLIPPSLLLSPALRPLSFLIRAPPPPPPPTSINKNMKQSFIGFHFPPLIALLNTMEPLFTK